MAKKWSKPQGPNLEGLFKYNIGAGPEVKCILASEYAFFNQVKVGDTRRVSAVMRTAAGRPVWYRFEGDGAGIEYSASRFEPVQ